MERLLITSTGAPGNFTARLESDGMVIVRSSRQPLVDGARVLIELGFDPATLLAMRHAGKPHDSFKPLPIGQWAKWIYIERDKGGLSRTPWMPFCWSAVGAKVGVRTAGRYIRP